MKPTHSVEAAEFSHGFQPADLIYLPGDQPTQRGHCRAEGCRLDERATEDPRIREDPSWRPPISGCGGAQAFPEHAILFLKIGDHIQLVAVDLTGEHHQQEVNSGEQGRHAAGCIRFSAIAALWSILAGLVRIVGQYGSSAFGRLITIADDLLWDWSSRTSDISIAEPTSRHRRGRALHRTCQSIPEDLMASTPCLPDGLFRNLTPFLAEHRAKHGI